MTNFFLLLCSLFFFYRYSSANIDTSNATLLMQQPCLGTRYQEECRCMISSTTLIKEGSNTTYVIRAMLLTTLQNLQVLQEKVRQDIPTTTLICDDWLFASKQHTMAAWDALRRSNPAVLNALSLGSTALSYQSDCWTILKHYDNSLPIPSTLSFFNDSVIVTTSNAISMLWALHTKGPDPAQWSEPHTERDGTWGPTGKPLHMDPIFNFADHTPDVTVCKNQEMGCYTTIQDAVNFAFTNLTGEKRFTIKINEGVYEEIITVPSNKTNLIFIGDGIGKTIITSSVSTDLSGILPYEFATVNVFGDGFFATKITFQNTGQKGAHQSAAFYSRSDCSYIKECEFISDKGTLCAHSNRQLYESCRIFGNVDFIFGNAAAIFKECTIIIGLGHELLNDGHINVIAANSRSDPVQTTGFVFSGCLINGTEDYMNLYHTNSTMHKTYLGRPLKMYSRTIYINCIMEELISPEGWAPYDGNFGLSTLYYGEFNNTGVGANMTKRVSWSNEIPEQHVKTYSVSNFLQGDEWILSDY